ncbi:hypothetical protein Tco_0281243 [Tanacetum coccineum]
MLEGLHEKDGKELVKYWNLNHELLKSYNKFSGDDAGDIVWEAGLYVDLGASLDPPWSVLILLELHLSSGDYGRIVMSIVGYGGSKARWKGVEGVRLQWSDKEVTKQNLVTKVVMKVLARLLGDMVVMS